MTDQSTKPVAVVVPNWDGKDSLKPCLDSLLAQTQPHRLIVVENGSTDGSLEYLQQNYPQVELVVNKTNRGFAGGVNDGIRRAMERGYEFVALFNNDAVAELDWLERLVEFLEVNREYGIATCRFVAEDKKHLDSTGECYTDWGLSFPRGRGEAICDTYDEHPDVFGASGGASLYRVSMLQEIGLFDEDFFAYYEDVDISWRAQLAAWRVRYVPAAVAYHQIGATSSKIKGFTTYQTLKNLPLAWFKNVPGRFFWRVGWRHALAQTLFLGRALSRGQGWPALKGACKGMALIGQKISERRHIQKTKKVSDEYLWAIMTHDLPPNATALRKLRTHWWKLTRRNA
jgi:GT2 family glycosyltransferase